MPDYQVTIDSETLYDLLSGTAGKSRLKTLLEQVFNQVLEQVLEALVREQIAAARYERSDERQGYRNGVHVRNLTTRVGPLTLCVPQVRDGEFSTDLFARY